MCEFCSLFSHFYVRSDSLLFYKNNILRNIWLFSFYRVNIAESPFVKQCYRNVGHDASKLVGAITPPSPTLDGKQI
jgi:hypothetical protein